MSTIEDCIIIGGGPAGLSAALVLGRCRRRVVVLDAGRPRNRGVTTSHGVLTRDGANPEIMREVAIDELARYDTVRVVDAEVIEVHYDPAGHGSFTARTSSGLVTMGKKLLLATGMRDRIPDAPGFRELLGKGVYVCPYCDAWEHRDRRIAVYGPAATVTDFALGLLTWSRDVAVVTPDERLDDTARGVLVAHDVAIHEERIAALEGHDGALKALVLASGLRLEREALFIHFGSDQAAPFAAQLGCRFGENRSVDCREGERAGVPGLFVAGDASHDLQLTSIAVAEGVKAACAINTELRRESAG